MRKMAETTDSEKWGALRLKEGYETALQLPRKIKPAPDHKDHVRIPLVLL